LTAVFSLVSIGIGIGIGIAAERNDMAFGHENPDAYLAPSTYRKDKNDTDPDTDVSTPTAAFTGKAKTIPIDLSP
jgi:hypothetical protein